MKMSNTDKQYMYRKISKMIFEFWNSYSNKTQAKSVADNLRNSNTLARIIYIPSKKEWYVYIKEIKPKKKLVFY